MQTELYDSKTDNIMCNADITFGPGTFIVNSCTGYDKYKDITPAQLEDFLSSRIHYEHTYAFDNIVLERIDMLKQKNLFGRMSDYMVLYALLNNFDDNDGVYLYPLRDELVSMIAYDSDLSNMYILRKRQ